MKPLVTIAGLCAVQALLAAVAIGAMVSIGAGRPNWLLIGVYVADSFALFVVAGYVIHRWHRGTRQ